MYACVFTPVFTKRSHLDLASLASQFAPHMEWNGPDTVLFPVDGLGSLFGTLHQIASAIAHQGAERGLGGAHLAIASNPDTALYAARAFPGVTVIPPGEEASVLSEIDIRALPLSNEMIDMLAAWGIRNFGQFATLPPLGVVERLGAEGLRLQDIARGAGQRPFVPALHDATYERHLDLDHPLDNLQPLFFLLNSMLAELTLEMERHGVATKQLRLQLTQRNRPPHECDLRFPVPLRRASALLKLTQLYLEANPPPSAILAIRLQLFPMTPQQAQGGLFTPTAPEPAQLQITLARVAALVGPHNLGAPERLDTHRPDAFQLRPYPPPAEPRRSLKTEQPTSATLAVRLFRPARTARVLVDKGQPRRVAAPGVTGNVVACAGPWRGSGDWWTHAPWARDEWDVSLTDGGIYRIYQEPTSTLWFVAGVYD
jgi:protein ImuB